ncbi:telomere-length maintenance and DNA damage repair-domain-containing protein [Thamnocephalis sphaerospora]|uniref:Telomere-length maintenance and DNA damage repair-domain-containing protein n=1 Tax=Thamnocephalis sphaerospora TaxID=78915 RepID=A0A4P9XHB0_9FUNG|nr:telomere-length maintenance and DNA damage repair-domain-containing protein [Thamnocephalis sphaerospora]|eukprot:RKP05042.1 telomere-length maintenance and DNA damage repair-domain-containing protein [Thamnocephalis sphaerospora]
MAALQQCCTLLLSGKAKERHDGQTTLRELLEARDDELVTYLDDAGWGRLIDSFLSSVEHERAELVAKQLSAIARGRLETRLSQLARDLRTLVDMSCRRLAPRAVRSILQHAIAVLPLHADALCWPLMLDYARALKTLLMHRPHRDRLVPSSWECLVQLCARGLLSRPPGERERGQPVLQAALEGELAQLFCVLVTAETVPLGKHAEALFNFFHSYFGERSSADTSGPGTLKIRQLVV